MTKEQIIAAIKAKFPAVNLSKTRLDEIAAILEAKITDDAQIDATLDEMNTYRPFANIAKEDDKVRDLQNKVKNIKPANNPKPTDTPAEDEEIDEATGKPKPKANSDEPPAWAKKLLDEVGQLRGEKLETQIQGEVAKKLKDIPSIYWAKRAMPKTLEEVQAFVDDVVTDFTDYTKGETEGKFKEVGKPGAGRTAAGGKAGDDKPASKEELDAVAKDLVL